MHGTVDNNSHAGDDTNHGTGLVYGDFYSVEAGNRLLEMQHHLI